MYKMIKMLETNFNYIYMYIYIISFYNKYYVNMNHANKMKQQKSGFLKYKIKCIFQHILKEKIF